MNITNINISKEKNKHLSEFAIENIIRRYNEFMTTTKVSFRQNNKNNWLPVPKRNIGKTNFIKQLAIEHNASLATIYNLIKKSKIEVLTNYKTKIEYSASAVIHKRKINKPSNNLKLSKALPFINKVISEIKDSKFNSVDEVVHDLILNRKGEILGYNTVCTKTIYNYIHAGLIDLKPIDLPRMLRRKSNVKYKTYTPKRQRGDSIDLRPFKADDRSEFGHWEGDLVTGPRDGENGAFLTLIERKTRFYYMIPIKNKKSKSVYMAINKLNKLYSDDFKKIFKSITFDNGAEFSRFKDMEIKPGTKEYKTKVYFAHPYASSERGSNEKCNQLIRYYIPKGTDINSLDIELIKFVQLGINNKKRKILGYKSAEFLFKSELKNLYNLEFNKLYLNF